MGDKKPKTKKMTLYIDDRIHLVIDHVAKCNRQAGNEALDTINKILVARIEYFCEQIENNPDLIAEFMSRIYSLEVLKKEQLQRLNKYVARKKRPYPFEITVSLNQRFDAVCDAINKEMGFKISKNNIHNIVFLDYVMAARDEIKRGWIEFMDQDYFIPYLPKENIEYKNGTFTNISFEGEKITDKIDSIHIDDGERRAEILSALKSLEALLVK